jgi:hypothetical protein
MFSAIINTTIRAMPVRTSSALQTGIKADESLPGGPRDGYVMMRG